MNDAVELEGRGGLRIRFVDDDEGALTVLELEIPRDRPIVPDIHQALFSIGVHISSVEVFVRDETIVERLRVAERDGARLAAERHLEVQIEVMEVIQRRLVDSRRPGLVATRGNVAHDERSRAVS